jgi:tetratricopeptide (TPR) repeat protein
MVLAGTARADSPADDRRREVARTLFNEGLEYSDAGRWHEAAERFRRAYQAKPTPEIGYNLAQAYVRLGYLATAAELLRRAEVDPDAPPAVREAARARLAQVSPRLGRLAIHLDPPAGGHAYLDGRVLEPARLGVAMPVDPGPHLLQARWKSGAELARRISVAEGTESTVVLAPAGTAPEKPISLFRRGWFWVAVAGIAAGTAVALTVPHLGNNQMGTATTAWHVDP